MTTPPDDDETWEPRTPWSRSRWGNVVDADGEIVIEIGDDAVLDRIVRAVNAEATLRSRCANLERARVGGGVLAGDLSTHELREAFGWPALPEPLDTERYAADLDRIRAVRESRKG